MGARAKDMTDRFFLFVGGLTSKAFAMLFTTCSAFIGVVIGEVTTNDLARAGVYGAIATCIAGAVLVVPRVMEQRRKSRESAAKIQADSIALLMSAHDRDLGFYQSEIAALKLERAMLTDARHKAAGEWFAAVNAYRILAGQLRGLGQQPEFELHPAKYLDIVGESDKSLKAIANARVAGPLTPL